MVAVFHHIGEPTEDKFTHSLSQIMEYDGLVTFDGAYKEVYRHRETLSHLSPILFIQWNTIGNTGVCTLDEIIELGDLGFTLGWHGRTHRRLTDLTDAQIMEELQPAIEVDLYAYPHGDFNGHIKELVAKAGYKKAYSTTQGDDTPYAIKREYV